MCKIIKKASDITECEDCPLFGNDCVGGWISSPSGTPIEPPCCSWNDDTEVYTGMYKYKELSLQEIKWAQEEYNKRENKIKEEKHKIEIERLKNKVRKLTGNEYKHIEFRRGSSICKDWLCPYCHTRQKVGSEWWHDGIGEAWCSTCNHIMVYCGELEGDI